jgi:hypothetical protein
VFSQQVNGEKKGSQKRKGKKKMTKLEVKGFNSGGLVEPARPLT